MASRALKRSLQVSKENGSTSHCCFSALALPYRCGKSYKANSCGGGKPGGAEGTGKYSGRWRLTEEFRLQYHPALQGPQSCAVLAPSPSVDVPIWQGVGTDAPRGQKWPMGQGPPICTAAEEERFCQRGGDWVCPTPARQRKPSVQGPTTRFPSHASPEPHSMH